ncbi:MAG: VTT domain-containing protein [Caldilineales bacterium]|nr:VTT domain-containing protein [Caldilineales bacterium]
MSITSVDRSAKRRTILLRVGAVVLMVALSALILLNIDVVRNMGRYGYIGVFAISFAANATLVLPAPGWLVPIFAGTALSPLAVGFAAGAGQALGELTGYFAGSTGQYVLEERSRYEQLKRLTERYGVWIFLVLSFIPNPIFDVAGIVAGALRFPIYKFLAATFVGKTARAILLAYGGYELISRWLG